MKIEGALTADAEGLHELTQLVQRTANSAAGFLLAVTSAEQFRTYIADGIVLVAREEAKLVGFLVAYTRGTPLFNQLEPALATVAWTDPSIAVRPNLLYVDKKCVHPDHRRQGVASALYRALCDKFPNFCLIGATVERPALNEASQAFRTRYGFRRVGTFRAQFFEGLTDYQSGIYVREGCWGNAGVG